MIGIKIILVAIFIVILSIDNTLANIHKDLKELSEKEENT